MFNTTRNTYYTDINDVLRHTNEIIRVFKSNAKFYKQRDPNTILDSRPICGKKRYVVEGEEVGTKPTMTRELEWWLDNGYFISRIWGNGLNQVVIEVSKARWTDMYTHLLQEDN